VYGDSSENALCCIRLIVVVEKSAAMHERIMNGNGREKDVDLMMWFSVLAIRLPFTTVG